MGVIIKNSLNVTIVNYIGVIIATVSILFIQTKILSSDQIGEIRLILDKSFLILPLVMLGMDSAALRFYFYFNKDDESKNNFLSILVLLPFLAFTFSLIILFLLRNVIIIENLEFIVTISFCYIYILIFEAYLNTKSKIIYPALLKNILFRLSFIGLILLYFYKIINFYNVLTYFATLHIAHLLLLSLYLKRTLDFKINLNLKFWNAPYFKEIIIFCLFLFIGNSSGMLVSKIDTIMLESITKQEGLIGIYTIAFSIITIIELPKRSIAQVTIPIIAKELANDNTKEVDIIYKKSALNLLIFAAFLFSLIWINIDFIFQLIPNGNVYKAGKYVVFFLGLSKVIDLGLGINSEIIHSSKHYRWNLILMPFLTVVTVSLNYFLISAYQSASSAAIATFVALILFNILRTVLVKWKLRLLPFSKEYFLVIPFIFIPFMLDYLFFGRIENLWIKMLLNSSSVILFFCLPIYYLKISPDINNIINKMISKIKSYFFNQIS